ncbi:MAG: hypothetical protein JWR38_1185 [Mucilaginibacter sp.]|nr:hypothetical protein [Mucilaginibacter sp.]
MKTSKLYLFILPAMILGSCQMKSKSNNNQQDTTAVDGAAKGTFAYDLNFLRGKDSIIVLKNNEGIGQVIVSPEYQAKVFTSTADGLKGKSFGWVNYKAFATKGADLHMNGYGGEDRLWLGPEGSKFSLFFKPGTSMVFDKWHTPAAIDKESWKLEASSDKEALLSKNTKMLNYAGTELNIKLERNVRILENADIAQILGIALDTTVKAVAFSTINSIYNVGTNVWDKQSGAPCLWSLDMFTPSPATTIVVPYEEKTTGQVATTDYFGQIPPDRVKFGNGILYFKADGKSRGKLGVPPNRVKKFAGSYDATNQVLTLITYDFDIKATYLNQEWKTTKDPFIGDAVNAYNDGPLENGTQMGPFYEIESVSPAAFLKPNEKLTHKHCVFHFTGNKEALNKIALKTLGVSIKAIQSAF